MILTIMPSADETGFLDDAEAIATAVEQVGAGRGWTVTAVHVFDALEGAMQIVPVGRAAKDATVLAARKELWIGTGVRVLPHGPQQWSHLYGSIVDVADTDDEIARFVVRIPIGHRIEHVTLPANQLEMIP